MILRFLSTNWMGIVSTALIALVALTILQARLDRAVAQRDQARAQIAILSDTIELQNEAVTAMAELAERDREEYLANYAEADRRAVRLEVKAEDVMALPRPDNPDNTCEAAADILREAMQ